MTQCRRTTFAIALVVTMPLAPVALSGEMPGRLCRGAATDDAVRPIPPKLVPAAKRLFVLKAPDDVIRRTTVFRCMDDRVLLCTTGANLFCGKANTGRTLAAAGRYCSENPNASVIPMVVTGHDTVYRWRCRGARADHGEPGEPLDARGFFKRLWRPVR